MKRKKLVRQIWFHHKKETKVERKIEEINQLRSCLGGWNPLEGGGEYFANTVQKWKDGTC
jgi:hypothetical protein